MRVQLDRAVRVGDALRVAGGAGGVAERGGVALVQLRPVVRRRPAGEQLVPVVHGDPVAGGGQQRRPGRRRRRPRRAARSTAAAAPWPAAGSASRRRDHPVLGVVGDVGELVGEEPDVERVQHRAHARAPRSTPPGARRCST